MLTEKDEFSLSSTIQLHTLPSRIEVLPGINVVVEMVSHSLLAWCLE